METVDGELPTDGEGVEGGEGGAEGGDGEGGAEGGDGEGGDGEEKKEGEEEAGM